MRAFINLCDRMPDIQFALVGDGPEKETCQRMVRDAGLEQRISFTGLLLGDEYKQELMRHHAIVLLSDYEGLPGSIMDGMSCGLIPICNGFAGANELIADGENGYIVGDRNGSFYHVVEQLYHNRELRRGLSARARQQIVRNFSIDSSVARWVSFIDECRSATGEKLTFHCPSRIRLPGPSPLLLEYSVKPTSLQLFCRKVQWRAGKLWR